MINNFKKQKALATNDQKALTKNEHFETILKLTFLYIVAKPGRYFRRIFQLRSQLCSQLCRCQVNLLRSSNCRPYFLSFNSENLRGVQ